MSAFRSESPIGACNGVCDWTSSGRGWGHSCPVPTIDITADPAGSGNVIVVGATATKHGTPTTVSSPYYPLGFTRANTKAVKLNGTDSYYDLGVGHTSTGAFTIAAVVRPASVSGSPIIVSIDSDGLGGTAREFVLYRGATSFTAYVFKSGGNSTITLSSGVVAGEWNVVCLSYNGSGGDGAAILRANVNGVAPAEVTNAVAPLLTSTASLLIGANGQGTEGFWDGDIARVTYWRETSMTAAQLAQVAASMMGSLPSRGS